MAQTPRHITKPSQVRLHVGASLIATGASGIVFSIFTTNLRAVSTAKRWSTQLSAATKRNYALFTFLSWRRGRQAGEKGSGSRFRSISMCGSRARKGEVAASVADEESARVESIELSVAGSETAQ